MTDAFDVDGVLPGARVNVAEIPGLVLVVPQRDMLRSLSALAEASFFRGAVPRGQLEIALARSGLDVDPAAGVELEMPVVLRWRNNKGLFDYLIIHGHETVAKLIDSRTVHEFTCVLGALDFPPNSSLQFIQRKLS